MCRCAASPIGVSGAVHVCVDTATQLWHRVKDEVDVCLGGFLFLDYFRLSCYCQMFVCYCFDEFEENVSSQRSIASNLNLNFVYHRRGLNSVYFFISFRVCLLTK